MAKKTFYSEEVKRKAVEMKLSKKYTNQQIMEELGIKNKAQLKTWMKWYRQGQSYRFSQPVGKQYSYGKGATELSELEAVKRENEHLKAQLETLKKYQEIERRWSQNP